MTDQERDPSGPLLLHYMPGTCALGVHIALEWAGAAYQINRVNRKDLRSDAYLALNPSGVVPTLGVGGEPLTEASAIMLWLARRFPDLGPRTDEARFAFERTVIFLGGTLRPYFWPWFTPERYGATSPEDQARVKRAAEQLIRKALSTLDAQLEGRAWLCGDQRSVADAYIFPMARWGYGLEHHPTGQFPNLDRLMRRLAALPDVQAVMAAEGLTPLIFPTSD